MKKTLVRLAACLCMPLSVSATVGVITGGGYLRDQGGDIFSNTGIILLVASTTDSVFLAPDPLATFSPSSTLAGDDIVLASFSAGSNGSFSYDLGQINLGSFQNLSVGDSLQLYWFPTLTSGSSTIGEGTSYGVYRNGTAVGNSDAWVMTGDGTSLALLFVTQAADGSSTLPDSLAIANLTTVPEPATTVALIGGVAGVFVAYRRRQKKTLKVTAA